MLNIFLCSSQVACVLSFYLLWNVSFICLWSNQIICFPMLLRVRVPPPTPHQTFLCIALAVLELSLKTRLASNWQRATHLCWGSIAQLWQWPHRASFQGFKALCIILDLSYSPWCLQSCFPALEFSTMWMNLMTLSGYAANSKHVQKWGGGSMFNFIPSSSQWPHFLVPTSTSVFFSCCYKTPWQKKFKGQRCILACNSKLLP